MYVDLTSKDFLCDPQADRSAQMTYSLCWSLINALYFKTPIDIFGNFLPGMIFFQSIFGYLVFTIFYKWSVDWPAADQQPPSLLNMLIYMFLQPGHLEGKLYSGQAVIQVILLLMAFVCVPTMLFLKPFYLRREHNKARAMGYRGIGETAHLSTLDDDDDEDDDRRNSESRMNGDGRASFQSDGEGIAMITEDIRSEEDEFEFSEEMIHQTIHTIGAYTLEASRIEPCLC